METIPSSRGCLKLSRTLLGNSASSSKNKTPPVAKLTSPGTTFFPPPIIEIGVLVWWGDLKGEY